MTGSRDVARLLAELQRRVEDLETTTRLGRSSIEGGPLRVYDDADTLRQVMGPQDDGTYTVRDVNAPAPPVPEAPTLGSQPGLLIVNSFGLTDDGSEWPHDFLRIDVHVGIPGFTITAASKVAEFGADGGSVPVALPAGTWAARLVSVNTSRVPSEGSVEVSASVPEPVTTGGVATYETPEPPVGAAVGSLWYDTDDGNALHRWDGTQWVALPPGVIESGDYTEAETGWRFDLNQRQVPDLNVLGALGAGTVSTPAITLGPDDLKTDLLDPKADGALGLALGDAVASTAGIGVNENIMFEYVPGDALAGRFYVLTVQALLFDAQARTGSYDMRVRYTTDGTAPTLASPILDGSQYRVNLEGAGSASFTLNGFYELATDSVPRFILTMQRTSGTCFAQIWNTTFDRAPMFSFTDWGTSVARGGLSQKSIDGGGSQPDPVVRYRQSFRPDWGRSYNGDSTIWQNSGVETVDLYQGEVSGVHGNTRSLVGGFRRMSDLSPISTVLSGSTIVRVQLTFRVRHAYESAGLDVRVGTHSNPAKPATFVNANPSLFHRDNAQAGGVYTFDLPTWVGDGLRNGTYHGVCFGPGDTLGNNFYGYLYGVGSSQPPQLTITYDK